MRSLWMVVGLMGVMVVVSADVRAADLRRPYTAAHAVSYGYDNGSASSGCTDYECGSICYNGHSGSDFPLSLGTDVLAGADGTVRAVHNGCDNYGYLGNTCGGRCGNYVQLEHANGDYTIYCHMQLNSLEVSTGESVSCGQVLGQSASSGSSTGPHLHLGWRPGGGSSTDVYAGSCNSSPGAWREQNGYDEAPGDSCGCVPSTEVCDGTDNNCDGTVDSGDVCEVEMLHQAPHAYAPSKTTDISGNGVQDVCGRFYSGFRCFGPTASGWEETASSSLMAEEDGWGAPQYYSTIRMGDVDGDGRADVCARHPDGFTCWRSTSDGFEEFGTVSFSDDGGWDEPEYYTTIRLADIDGDGRDDVCARGASGWRCYLSTPEGFGERIEGPQWSDAEGFDRARYFGTIRVGDITGDGRDDVCMREDDGFSCYQSTGDGFEHLTTNGGMADEHGWGNKIYWPSIRLADIDGDGTKAVCARDSSTLFCRRFDGSSFGSKVQLGGLGNDSGWSDPTNYATLRVGDVTGDGSDDLCIRANAGMLCYRVDGDDVSRFDGPQWSNANGWEAQASHGPIFITNVDDTDERGALCGRSEDGLTCENYVDGGFELHSHFDEFSDSGGWTARKYYSTIRMGQGVCRGQRCEDEDVEDDDDGDSDTVDPGSDVGYGADVGGTDETGTTSMTTSSCAAAQGRPTGLVWVLLSALLGLWWSRRRRAVTTRVAAALVVAGSITLVGCEQPEPEAEATASSPEVTEATGTQGVDDSDREHVVDGDERDVLAIHGTWRVLGDALAVPERSDGPLRYRPVLVDDGEEVEWPLDLEIVSEVRIVGEEPTLFALTPAGRLVRVPLDGDERGESIIVDDEISSQITVAPDGCCVAYIRHAAGQYLHIYRVHEGESSTIELGYSLGWAPALAAGGQKVAWTASPKGYASILVSGVDDDEPRLIVNREDGLEIEDLAPTPDGVHMPIWTGEGIAFEAGTRLWLVDEDGEFVGQADAEGGMFWDEIRGELVDGEGETISWDSEGR